MKHVTSLILVLLLIVSGSLGYAYHQKSVESEKGKNGLISALTPTLHCLEEITLLKPMIEHNATRDPLQSQVLHEKVRRFNYCAWVLADIAGDLYQLTKDEKYWNLHSAASNLEVFLNHVNVHYPYAKDDLERNADLFEEIGESISEIYKSGRGNFTNAQTERLLNLTEGLSW